MEAWGASGGDILYYGTDNLFHGGYGGYSIGVTKLKLNKMIYVNVGGNGISNQRSRNVAVLGGYNGGGSWMDTDSWADDYPADGFLDNRSIASGGGATHIATVSGLLKNLSTYRNTGGTNISKEILLVSSGGGAAYSHDSGMIEYTGNGGNGGGVQGNKGEGGTLSNYYGTGGTQTAGGYSEDWQWHTMRSGGFGYGGDIVANTEYIEQCDNRGNGHGGPGGSGWFGGGASLGYSGCANSGGGGGSGYIGSSNLISGGGITKHMTCYSCTTSTATATRTISNTNVSATATSDYSKTGNGYAKILYLGPTI